MFIKCSIDHDPNEVLDLNEVIAINKCGSEGNYMIGFGICHRTDNSRGYIWHYMKDQKSRDADYDEIYKLLNVHELGMKNVSGIE